MSRIRVDVIANAVLARIDRDRKNERAEIMSPANEIQRRGLVADIERFREAANAALRLGGEEMTTTFRDWVTILEARLRILDMDDEH